jgi:hypothetical protein
MQVTMMKTKCLGDIAETVKAAIRVRRETQRKEII